MESEKVKEILKFCSEGKDCYDGCPYKHDTHCVMKISKNALTLINELESENERLLAEKKKVIEYMKTDNYAKLKKEDMYWGYQMGIGMLEHEIDRQKDRIALLEKDNKTLRNAKVVYENVDYCYEDLKKAEKRIAELEKEKTCVWEEWTDGYHSIWCCSNCKEDFCFIEGDVYENNYGYCPHCGAKITALKELKEDNEIDETLKEFIK